MISVRPPREPFVREWLNPLWIQHGTFVTPLSVSECEQILLAHTVSRWVGHLTHPDVIQQEPNFPGRIRNGKFSLREQWWFRYPFGEPELNGVLRETPNGASIKIRLRAPLPEALPLALLGPGCLAFPIFAPGLRGIAAVLLGGAFTAYYIYLRWSRRNDWDYYAWFIETFLSAKLVKWESKPY